MINISRYRWPNGWPAGNVESGQEISLTFSDETFHWEHHKPESKNTEKESRPKLLTRAALGRISWLRKFTHQISLDSPLTALVNERTRLQIKLARAKQLNQHSSQLKPARKRLKQLCRDLDDFEAFFQKLIAVENNWKLAWHGLEEVQLETLENLEEYEPQLGRLAMRLSVYQFQYPNTITLALFGKDTAAMLRMTQIYAEVALSWGMQIKLERFFNRTQPDSTDDQVTTKGKGRRGKKAHKAANDHPTQKNPEQRAKKLEERGIFLAKPPLPQTIEDSAELERWLSDCPSKLLCVSLEVEGPLATILLIEEKGGHLWKGSSSDQNSLISVETQAGPWWLFTPPEGIEKPGHRAYMVERRQYSKSKVEVHDTNSGFRYKDATNWTELMSKVLENNAREESKMRLCP